jgi:hypothetical protein
MVLDFLLEVQWLDILQDLSEAIQAMVLDLLPGVQCSYIPLEESQAVQGMVLDFLLEVQGSGFRQEKLEAELMAPITYQAPEALEYKILPDLAQVPVVPT